MSLCLEGTTVNGLCGKEENNDAANMLLCLEGTTLQQISLQNESNDNTIWCFTSEIRVKIRSFVGEQKIMMLPICYCV